jgi:hypothetical protein
LSSRPSKVLRGTTTTRRIWPPSFLNASATASAS